MIWGRIGSSSFFLTKCHFGQFFPVFNDNYSKIKEKSDLFDKKTLRGGEERREGPLPRLEGEGDNSVQTAKKTGSKRNPIEMITM